MKTKLILILLLLISAMPALAQDGSLQNVAFGDFGFAYDTATYNTLTISLYAGDSPELPGGFTEVAHTQYLLNANYPAPESLFDSGAGIRVYRIADMAAYPSQSQQVSQLQALLANRDSIASESPTQLLPFMPVPTHGQVIRARTHFVDTAAVSGIAYVTAYAAASEPFLSDSFLYTFQGLSADGEYYVSAIFRPTTSLFPSEIAQPFDITSFVEKFDSYLAEANDKINAAERSAFSPSLDSFEAIINSLTFAD